MILGILGVVVAALALGVSIWSVISTHRTARRQAELQERLLALEMAREESRVKQAQRANVRAVIRKTSGDWWLVVGNEGPATARNVHVEFDGGPLMEHTLFPRGQDEVTLLGPGVSARYVLAPAQGKPMVVNARVVWDDDSGAGRSWESQLSLM